MLAAEGGHPDSTSWAYGDRLPAAAAAFVNGMSSSALDYDSLGRDAPVHVNIVVLPAALAVAARTIHNSMLEIVRSCIAEV